MIQILDDEKTLERTSSGKCIRCEAGPLFRYPLDPRGRVITRKVRCLVCDYAWVENYELTYLEVQR